MARVEFVQGGHVEGLSDHIIGLTFLAKSTLIGGQLVHEPPFSMINSLRIFDDQQF